MPDLFDGGVDIPLLNLEQQRIYNPVKNLSCKIFKKILNR